MPSWLRVPVQHCAYFAMLKVEGAPCCSGNTRKKNGNRKAEKPAREQSKKEEKGTRSISGNTANHPLTPLCQWMLQLREGKQ